MGHTLRLPDGFEFPEEVNGWQFDPEPYNGNAWLSANRETSVVVHAGINTAYVTVVDERVSGSENNIRIADPESDSTLADATDRSDQRTTAAAMVERAVAWMRSASPSEWTHPAVNEAVFDTPPGYELANYSLGVRETVVHYHRESADQRRRLAGAGQPDVATPETYPYLVVRMWNGSGNADVVLAPWRYEHDEERVPVVDPPAECGLDIALSMARQYTREHVNDTANESLTGQTDLQQFTERGRP